MAYFSVPSNIIMLICLLGLLFLLFCRTIGAIIAGGALAAIVAAGMSPIGNILLIPLEQRFPEGKYPDERAIQGIIVLGGSYDSQSHGYISTIVLGEDTDPMAIMVDLAHRYPKTKIIFSGGTDPTSLGPTEAGIARQYFISFGIPADRIWIEDRSQTTAENAQFTARLLNPPPHSRWLLVTSSYHMSRAVGAFRKAGFNVIAFPVGSRTHGWKELWRPATTATENLRRLDVAVHEWLGMFYYALAGYSDDWYAAPRNEESTQVE